MSKIRIIKTMKKGMIGIVCAIFLASLSYLAFTHFCDTEPKQVQEEVNGKIVKVEGDCIYLEDGKYNIEKAKKDYDTYYLQDEVTLIYTHVEGEELAEEIIVDEVRLTNRDETTYRIEKTLSEMTLEEKVGQLFMVRCPTDGALEALKKYHIGGYIMFDQNIQPYTKDEFTTNNALYQDASKLGLFIGIDEEGGIVNRLSWYLDYRNVPFASPQELFAANSWEAIQLDTQEKCDLLKSVGINVNFAPVADVSTNPNDFMYPRTFGQSPEQTGVYVENVVVEMKAKQIGSVLKHFPGYGNNSDTHTGSSYDTRPYEQFITQDFLPFQKGIDAGADFVLVNHNIVSCMDDTTPASLSSEVHRILREELNYEGIIITDDLIMNAITNTYGDEKSAVLAIQAGNDMVISSNYEVQINSVINAIHDCTLKEDAINDSVRRILYAKIQLNILK